MPRFGEVIVQTWEQPSTLLPSPSVWARSPASDAITSGFGYCVTADFKTGSIVRDLTVSSTTGTAIAYDANYDSVVKMTTGTVANTGPNAIALMAKPLGIPTTFGPNSYEFEAIVAVNQTTNTEVFIGIGNNVATSTASSLLSAASSTAASTNTIQGSVVGFFMHADNSSTFDAIYQNGAGGIQTVLASTLQASVFNTASTQPQLMGMQIGQGQQPPTQPVLGSTDFVKFGLIFSPTGNQFGGLWSYFVNGVRVCTQQANGYTDNASSYAPVVVVGSVSSTALQSIDVGYVRAAYHANQ